MGVIEAIRGSEVSPGLRNRLSSVSVGGIQIERIVRVLVRGVVVLRLVALLGFIAAVHSLTRDVPLRTRRLTVRGGLFLLAHLLPVDVVLLNQNAEDGVLHVLIQVVDLAEILCHLLRVIVLAERESSDLKSERRRS